MRTNNKSLLISLILAFLLSSYFPVDVKAHSNQKSVFQEEIDTAIIMGFDYIASQVNDDGGIRWIDENSSVAATIRVVQALAAAGYTQDFIESEAGYHPIDFLEADGWLWVNQTEAEAPGFSPARAGQLLTAVAAANKNPHGFSNENVDLIYEINKYYDRNTTIYENSVPDNVLDQVWSMIGLAANNASVPEEAADWLASAQSEDGSWNDGFGSLLDTTPLAVMALVGSTYYDSESPVVQSALNFLQANQQENGGWQSEWDTATNPNTTGVIIQAISSLGQSPTDQNWQEVEGGPLTALVATQQENGIFGGEFGNAYSTADAIIGLTGQNITRLGFLERASKALDYLITIQEADGGWGDVGQTLDVMIALSAAGWQPKTITTNGASPLDYIREFLLPYIYGGPDAIGKVILGISAAGENPGNFNGIDLGSILMESFDESSQALGNPENTWHQALGILGLYTAGIEIPDGAAETLAGLQRDNGGWEYSSGLGTSPDSTALAVQALLASGVSDEDQVIKKGLDYLHNTQSKDGGWDDSSTISFAIMALNALNQTSDQWTPDSGRTPVPNLVSYQKTNGAFVYSWDFPDGSAMSTASALLALLGGDLIIQPPLLPKVNHAAIVIDPGNKEIQTACVDFTEESITGMELLEISGLDYTTDQDGFLTSLVNISNPEGGTNYWSYWHWDGREWQFHNTGAANTIVLPGSVEAWHFTSWEQFPSLPSDFIPNINEICEEDVLADFSQQPYLDYNNLAPFALQQQAEIEPSPEEMSGTISDKPAAESSEVFSTETTPEQNEMIQPSSSTEVPAANQQQQGSPLALFLIAGLGIILITILVILYLRKNQ